MFWLKKSALVSKYKQKIPENLIKNIQASDKIYVNAWNELMPCRFIGSNRKIP